MGISRAAVHYLITEAKKKPFTGRVLTLGVQQMTISEKELRALASRYDYPLTELEEGSVPKFDRHQHLTDLFVLKSLGFTDVIRTDVSDFQGAELVFDMNAAEIPDGYAESFDVIIDSGTIEHVFHIPNTLKNIFSFLKTGGRVIHMTPSSNHVDHGFYMFSPTLFWDYYLANQFEIDSMKFFEYNRWGNTQEWIAADYEPGCLRFISGGGLPRGVYGIIMAATKTESSTSGVVPQQHRYAKTWSRKKAKRSSKSMWHYRARKRAEQFWKRVRVRRFPLKVTDRY